MQCFGHKRLGQAVGRLVAITTKGTGTYTNAGDFYMTFHVHVTRP